MNRFATRIAASTMVIAAAMVSCHSDSVMATAFASGGDRSEQQAGRLAEQARTALRRGDAARALALAERAVEMSPRDSGYRMLLADLYLHNGRFRSAETSYADVVALDPGNVRAGLSIALAQIAQGRNGDALVQLEAVQDSAPATDVGLAYALAGQPQRAIALLEPAARAVDANGRTRQNLALAYALAGDWPRARIVAAQDVSPAELGPRLRSWASLAEPSGAPTAVANLLGVTPAADPGQPVRLALSSPEPAAQAYAEAEPAPAPEPVAEAPVRFAEAPAAEPQAQPEPDPIQFAEAPVVPAAEPVQVAEAPVVPAPQPTRFSEAPVVAAPVPAPEPAAAQSGSWWPSEAPVSEAVAPVAAPAPETAPAPARAEQPVRYAAAPAPARSVQPVRYAAPPRVLTAPSPVLNRTVAPARTARPIFRAAPIVRASSISARIPRAGSGAGRFVVQLGAFSNPQNAERAWQQAERRFGLANAEARTATIHIGGRTLHRVSIAGFGSRADAVRVCSSIQARGGSCFVRNVAGDVPVRWASRSARNGRA